MGRDENEVEVLNLIRSCESGEIDGTSIIRSARRFHGAYGELVLSKLVGHFDPYPVRNGTDWNYSSCFSFEIFLHPNLAPPHISRDGVLRTIQETGGVSEWASLDLSALGSYAVVGFGEDSVKKSSKKIRRREALRPFTPNQCEANVAISSLLRELNFVPLSGATLRRVLPTVTLELASPGEVSVYNYLFHDTDGKAWSDFSEEEHEFEW